MIGLSLGVSIKIFYNLKMIDGIVVSRFIIVLNGCDSFFGV